MAVVPVGGERLSRLWVTMRQTSVLLSGGVYVGLGTAEHRTVMRRFVYSARIASIYGCSSPKGSSL